MAASQRPPRFIQKILYLGKNPPQPHPTPHFNWNLRKFTPPPASLTHKNMQQHLTLSKAAMQRLSVKELFLKNYAKFTGKHLCSSVIVSPVLS